MRTKSLIISGVSAFLALTATTTSAHAEQILEQKSSWNEARDFIYTDFKIRRDDGSIVTHRAPGGSVDGIGMVQFHSVIGPEGVSDQTLAFLRATSKKSGVQLRWDRSVIYITPDAAGSSQIDGDQEHQILESVLGAWEDAVGGCSYMKFVVDAPAAGEARYDGKNVVKYREEKWCRPASGMDPGKCYEPAAAAITTVFYVDTPGKPNDGIIRDADIELNGVNFSVGVCDESGECTTGGAQSVVSDLANTMTHEVGHLLGMDHTCWDQAGTPPNDDQGVPVPICGGALPPKVTEATMYNFQDSGEIKKRTIEADDVNGVCNAYPTSGDPECDVRALESCNDSGSCTIAPPGSAPSASGSAGALRHIAGAAGFLVAIIGGVRAWRRRRSVLSRR